MPTQPLTCCCFCPPSAAVAAAATEAAATAAAVSAAATAPAGACWPDLAHCPSRGCCAASPGLPAARASPTCARHDPTTTAPSFLLRRDGINSTFLPKEDFSNLPKFEKNFYYEHPAVTARSDDEVRGAGLAGQGCWGPHRAASCAGCVIGRMSELCGVRDGAQQAMPACALLPALGQRPTCLRHAVLSRLLHLLPLCIEQVRRYREQRDIHVTGEGVPKPVTTFEEASFPGEGGWGCIAVRVLSRVWPRPGVGGWGGW